MEPEVNLYDLARCKRYICVHMSAERALKHFLVAFDTTATFLYLIERKSCNVFRFKIKEFMFVDELYKRNDDGKLRRPYHEAEFGRRYAASIHFLGEEVDKWPLMSNPLPVIGIVAAYLYFVLKLGPAMMQNREPFNIKPIMLVYNLYQTLSNGHMVLLLFITDGGLNYLWSHACYPMDPAINPYWFALNRAAWLYMISKIVDLLDTVFMILRKKYGHITFLHVYHHANMVLFSWVYLKYIKGEQGVVAGSINAFIHVIMYAYYFLAALGPRFQKYLWWKRYITRMQMIQFIIIFAYMMTLLYNECPLPKAYSIFLLFQTMTFLILFGNFYIKTYIMKSKAPNTTAKKE